MMKTNSTSFPFSRKYGTNQVVNPIEYGKGVFVIVIFIIQFINSAQIGIGYFIIKRDVLVF